MKLRTKLIALSTVAILAIFLVGLTGINGIRQLSESIDEVDHVRLPSIVSLANVTEGQTAISAANLGTAIYENNYQSQAKFVEIGAKKKAIWERIDKNWKIFEPLPQTPEEEKLWKQFLVEWQAWQSGDKQIDAVIAALARNTSEDKQKALFIDYFQRIEANSPLFTASETTLGKLIELNVKVADEAAAAGKADADQTYLVMLGVSLAAMGTMIFLGAFVGRSVMVQVGGEPAYAVQVADKIAAGDLSVEVVLQAGDDASMLSAMNKMRDNLARMVADIRNGTESIASASSQIAAGNANLSSRTEEQASSLEETASSIEELTSTVKQNADNSRQANSLALSASDVARRGGAVVSEVVITMSSINESARKIFDIISVIDGIAFQTNILALNAAVEAARAGEQGRGFAVVASEVRNLAHRSAAAAKEIKVLIGDSVEKVESGSKLVDQAGTTMDELVSSVKRVSDIVSEITLASNEQASGIDQINMAIAHMDDVTQQNAALVEEAAAASEALQEQADSLARLVSVFKTADAHLTLMPRTVALSTPSAFLHIAR